MQAAFAPIMRDYLVRFQQTAVKETGRRPMTPLREPMDTALVLPGCHRPGYAFWQPAAWPVPGAPLGERAGVVPESVTDYLSMCQFLEIRIALPVAPLNSPLSFLHGRVFETYPNTQLRPPAQALGEAALYARENPELPLSYCMAATCDTGDPLLLQLRATDGQAYVARADQPPLYLRLTVDRLLPKLKFVYDL